MQSIKSLCALNHLRSFAAARPAIFYRKFHFNSPRFSTLKNDPWTLLGVSRGATEDDIKKAWRKKAKELHPDLNPKDPTAKERFQETKHAYEILTNADQRAKYEMEAEYHPRRHPSARYHHSDQQTYQQQQQDMDHVWRDFERMFSEMHQRPGRPRPSSGRGGGFSDPFSGKWQETVTRGPFGEFRTYTWHSNSGGGQYSSQTSSSSSNRSARRNRKAAEAEHDIFKEIFDSFWGMKKPTAQFDDSRAYDFLPTHFQMKNVGTRDHLDFEITNETLSFGNVRQKENDPSLLEHVLEDQLLARGQLYSSRAAGGLTQQHISVTDSYGNIIANIATMAPHSLLTNFVREIDVIDRSGEKLMSVTKSSYLFNRFTFRDLNGNTIATAGRSLASAGAPYRFTFSQLNESVHPSLFVLPVAFFNVEKKWSVIEALKQFFKALF